MSITIQNTRELIDPDKFKWKVLIYGLSGLGKTEWASDAPNPGVVACETGQGKGLLTVARKQLDYTTPTTYQEFEQIASGLVFKDKDSLVIDSLTDMANTFVKDAAIAIPRSGTQSAKRAQGLPELDDYGMMGELTRRVLRKILDGNKHVAVTATLRIKEPDASTGQGQFLIGPDLPGALMLGSCAMFDTVMCLKTRSKLRDPKDPKTRYTERYFVTASDGNGLVAKCRSVVEGGQSLLSTEEVFDITTGTGSFPYLLNKIKLAYADFWEKAKHKPTVAVAA